MYKRSHKKSFYRLSLVLVVLLIFTSLGFASTGDGSWDSPYNVSQAISNQNGSTKTIQGYIVGEPISSTNVNTSSFIADYAIALADSKVETNESNMVYIQVSSENRNSFGLKTNPEMMGEIVRVTGVLQSYFAHSGVKSISRIENVSSGGDPIDPNVSIYDSTYYKNAIGQSGYTLKNTLHNIIDDHNELSYASLWDALRHTDEDPNNSNNVIEIYTGRSISKYENGGLVDEWNREHVWAKSHGDFGTSNGAGTDLHHIRPADVSVNSDRGNLDFDEGGNYNSEATQCRSDSDSWEPRDDVKGDVARMIFYMAVRYEGDSGEVDLELLDNVSSGTSPYHGKLSVLLKWNAEDPVDDWERTRNDIIYNDYQFNRNPFIDHPEWINEIW
ncbi:MAG: endonuclease [Acidaminobacteraceae bacterium]